jgi:hypothetical protein
VVLANGGGWFFLSVAPLLTLPASSAGWFVGWKAGRSDLLSEADAPVHPVRALQRSIFGKT